MSEQKRPGVGRRRTSTVLDAWLRSRSGPRTDELRLGRGERLHEARVYPGRIPGYRLELLSKVGAEGIALVATLLRPDTTVSFQRRWDGLDEAAYERAVGEVEREVERLGLCDPSTVEVHRAQSEE